MKLDKDIYCGGGMCARDIASGWIKGAEVVLENVDVRNEEPFEDYGLQDDPTMYIVEGYKSSDVVIDCDRKSMCLYRRTPLHVEVFASKAGRSPQPTELDFNY